MGEEINLLAKFPRVARDTSGRAEEKTDEDRRIARQFGKEFFDGPRRVGLGGYHYHPKFWQPAIPDFQKRYNLTSKSKILDVGCAKGFMLLDFMKLIPGIAVRGIDISAYAIQEAPPEVKPFLTVGDALSLPYNDREFDLVISISTLHNLEGDALIQGFKEVQRVSRGKSFVFVDGYYTLEERDRIHEWNLTARSILPVHEWHEVFAKAGYTGDYYWFCPPFPLGKVSTKNR